MIAAFVLLSVLLLPINMLVVYDQPPEVQNSNPKIKMSITVSDPLPEGLRLDNQWAHVVVNLKNVSDEPIYLYVSGDYRQVKSESSTILDEIHEYARPLPAGDTLEYKFDRVLFAGNYKLYVIANVASGPGPDRTFIGPDARGEVYFTVSTQQELFAKRTLDQNYQLMGITGAGVATAIGTIIVTLMLNRKQRLDTKEHIDRQLKLQQESNEALKESNRLTRESLALKQTQLKAAIGAPEIMIVNTGLEGSGRTSMVKLYPNFRNDGKVPARNIRIHYKVMDKVVNIHKIVELEQEIKKLTIWVDGSVTAGQSVNLNDGRAESGISWEKKDESISVVIWFRYLYLENEEGEVVFNLHYSGENIRSKPIRYTSEDLGML